jgi:hypothetical protein
MVAASAAAAACVPSRPIGQGSRISDASLPANPLASNHKRISNCRAPVGFQGLIEQFITPFGLWGL